MTGFSALDIVLLLAVFGGIIQGIRRGFTQEVLSLAALIVALFAVRLFHEGLSLWLMEIIGNEQGAGVLAFAVIMGVVWGGGKLAAARIGGMMRNGVIGPVDRILGAGFGALKALLIVAAGFMLVALASDFVFGRGSERPRWMTESRSYPLLSATGAALSDLVAQRLGRDDADGAARNSNGAEARDDSRP
jgi:membrane protein required for colicin V production